MNKRELIELRARQIFRLAEQILIHHDPTDFTVGTAFRYAYLITRRSPRAFFSAFNEGDLRISPDEVAEFIWAHADDIEPPNGLLPEERATIERHNHEATAIRQPQSSPNVLALNRNMLGRT